MLDILNYLPAKRKSTPSGWISFNCPLCGDRRSRGGLKTNEQGWSYHCFNCGFKASFILGRNLSYKAKSFLRWLHVPDDEIERINLESLKHKSVEGLLVERQQVVDALMDIQFEEKDLPHHVDFLEPNSDHWDYLKARGVPMDYPYMTEGSRRQVGPVQPRKAIVIPFTHNNNIVGYSKRFLDNRIPKYINETQPGYVFGTDLQKDDWKYAIVVEGVFDALSINGLAVLHNDINDAQARLIRSLGKEVIVVPDQDKAGLALIDKALEYGWSVSVPPWPAEVKDVNDAVKLYGVVGTLLSILEHKCHGKIKITMASNNLRKKIDN